MSNCVGNIFELAIYENSSYQDQFGQEHSCYQETNVVLVEVTEDFSEKYGPGPYQSEKGTLHAVDTEGNKYSMCYDTWGEGMGSIRYWSREGEDRRYQRRTKTVGIYPVILEED